MTSTESKQYESLFTIGDQLQDIELFYSTDTSNAILPNKVKDKGFIFSY